MNVNINLRSANNDDTETVARILISSRLEYLPFAKSPHSSDGFSRWVGESLISSGGVVIAQLDGEDVGVLATSVSEGAGWIDQLYLAPCYVGLGIGAELLAHALSVLPRPIRLWTFQKNDMAIRFYEHYGFKAIEYTNGEYNEEKCSDVLYEYE